MPLLEWLWRVPDDFLLDNFREPHVVREYERWYGPSILGENELEKEVGGPSEPYMEMISELVSLSELFHRRPAPEMVRWLARDSDLKIVLTSSPVRDLAHWCVVAAGAIGLMLKMPMSPVSVVVLSMLSRGPGDGSKLAFSLTLLNGRRGRPYPMGGRAWDL